MPHPCDQACQNGTEEECTACILTHYAQACESQKSDVAKAKELGRINASEANSLTRYIEHGEERLRAALGK